MAITLYVPTYLQFSAAADKGGSPILELALGDTGAIDLGRLDTLSQLVTDSIRAGIDGKALTMGQVAKDVINILTAAGDAVVQAYPSNAVLQRTMTGECMVGHECAETVSTHTRSLLG